MKKRTVLLLVLAVCVIGVIAPSAQAQTTSEGVWIWPWDGTPYDPNTGEVFDHVPAGSEVTIGFGWLTAGYGNIKNIPRAYLIALSLYGPGSDEEPIVALGNVGGRDYWGEIFQPPADWGLTAFNPRSGLRIYMRQWGVHLGVLPAGTYTFRFAETVKSTIVDLSTAVVGPGGQPRPVKLRRGHLEPVDASFVVAP